MKLTSCNFFKWGLMVTNTGSSAFLFVFRNWHGAPECAVSSLWPDIMCFVWCSSAFALCWAGSTVGLHVTHCTNSVLSFTTSTLQQWFQRSFHHHDRLSNVKKRWRCMRRTMLHSLLSLPLLLQLHFLCKKKTKKKNLLETPPTCCSVDTDHNPFVFSVWLTVPSVVTLWPFLTSTTV